MIRAAAWAWSRLSEPREQRAFHFIVYSLTAFAGASALIAPPPSVMNSLGQNVTYVWATALLICGLTGIVAVNPGAWWLERIACDAGIVGILMYGCVIFSAQLSPLTTGNRIPGIALLLIVLTLFGFRRWRIRLYAYEPRE